MCELKCSDPTIIFIGIESSGLPDLEIRFRQRIHCPELSSRAPKPFCFGEVVDGPHILSAYRKPKPSKYSSSQCTS